MNPEGHTVTIVALGHTTIADPTSLLEAVHVLFRRRGPAGGELGSLRLLSKLVGHNELLVQLSLEVDDSVCISDGLFDGNKIDLSLCRAQAILKIDEGSFGSCFGILLDDLFWSVEA